MFRHQHNLLIGFFRGQSRFAVGPSARSFNLARPLHDGRERDGPHDDDDAEERRHASRDGGARLGHPRRKRKQLESEEARQPKAETSTSTTWAAATAGATAAAATAKVSVSGFRSTTADSAAADTGTSTG